MSASFEFSSEERDRHLCRSWQEGAWIIMQCTECGFLRRMNWKTGAVHLDHPGRREVLHSARHQPMSLDRRQGSVN